MVLVVWLADGTLTPTGAWAYVVGVLVVLLPAGVVVLASRRTAAGVLCALAAAATGLLAAAANDVWWLGVAAATAAFLVTAIAETGRRDRYRWLPVTTVSALSLLLLAVTGSGLSWVVDRWRGEGMLPTGYAWVTAVFTGAVIAAALGAVVYLLFRRWEAWPVARVTKEYWGQAEPCRTVMATKAGRRRAVSDLAGSVDVLITVVVWVAASALLVGVVRAGRPAMDSVVARPSALRPRREPVAPVVELAGDRRCGPGGGAPRRRLRHPGGGVPLPRHPAHRRGGVGRRHVLATPLPPPGATGLRRACHPGAGRSHHHPGGIAREREW